MFNLSSFLFIITIVPLSVSLLLLGELLGELLLLFFSIKVSTFNCWIVDVTVLLIIVIGFVLLLLLLRIFLGGLLLLLLVLCCINLVFKL